MKRFLVTLGLLLCSLEVRAEEKIDRLIRDLGSPSYREREKACRELEAIGAEAMPALIDALKSSDDEILSRAQTLIERIDKTVQSQKYLAAPLLSLNFEDVPLEQAVQEFATKTNLYLDLSKVANRNRKVRLHVENQPYWKVVEAFYSASGLMEAEEPANNVNPAEQAPGRTRVSIYPNARGRRPVTGPRLLMAEGTSSLSAAVDRAIRVRAKGPSRIQYDEGKGEITVPFELLMSPDLSLQRIVGLDIYRAVANDNRELRIAYPTPRASTFDELLIQQRGGIVQGGMVILEDNTDVAGNNLPSEQVTFKTEGIRPTSFKELSGVVHVQLVTPPECLLTFKDLHLGDNNGQTDGRGLTCHKITISELNERFYTVQMELTFTPTEANSITYMGRVRGQIRPLMQLNRVREGESSGQPQIRFLDGDGSVLNTFFDRKGNPQNETLPTTISVSARVRKPNTPDGMKIEIHASRSLALDMPFTLRNVPLK